MITSLLESILFVAGKPMSCPALAKAIEKSEEDVSDALEILRMKYNREDSGIRIFFVEDTVQMGTNPAHGEFVERFVERELSGELTKAQLETLTVIAYRGPVTRPELEQIRGVNCALIIRNLLIRGLITEIQNNEKLAVEYVLSMEALRHLAVSSSAELPEYESLHAHAHIEQAVLETDTDN